MLSRRLRWSFALLAITVCVCCAADVKLPPPYATPSADNGPRVVPQPSGAQLHVPDGFSVNVYAEGFTRPRYMLLGPSGELLLSDAADGPDGVVYAMPLSKPGGYQVHDRKKLITGLDRPYGLALWHEYLYVGEPESIKRYKYDAKAMTAGPGEEVISLKGFSHGHWTRSLLFDHAGTKLYVGVGSASNVSTGEDPLRAAINRYNPDGSGHEIFASGTRNPIGLHWYPNTETLWAAVQERDALGDDLVPDYFTHIEQGGFYGWPYAYIGPHEDPRNKDKAPDLVKKTITPDIVLQPAHVAVLDFEFYTGTQFPAEYRNGAFLALHGSWNRAQRTGYKIAFVPFQAGKPSGMQRDFLTGWMVAPESRDVWGRPVGLLFLPDGSMLVTDDGGRKLWRVTYGANPKK
jgi:glucose/arabinose dehydrogenase